MIIPSQKSSHGEKKKYVEMHTYPKRDTNLWRQYMIKTVNMLYDKDDGIGASGETDVGNE
jgi:hypothetical protein